MIYLKQLELGPMANYVYLVGDPETKECAVIDPAWNVQKILDTAREDGYKITKALATHNHPDHTNGLPQLLQERDIPIYIHKEDAFALEGVEGSVKQVSGGDKAKIGKIEVTFLHTPGHTEGSQCFQFRDRLLTGDTLFIRGCGRVDLPGSDPEKMYHSLRKLASLDGKTTLFPGHNYSEESSVDLETERGQNPYLRAVLTLTPSDFLKLTSA